MDRRGHRRFHVDRRAPDLLARAEDLHPDLLISTTELSRWFGLAPETLEIWRHRRPGPKFIALSPRRIRYKVSDVFAWLTERSRVSTRYITDQPKVGGRVCREPNETCCQKLEKDDEG